MVLTIGLYFYMILLSLVRSKKYDMGGAEIIVVILVVLLLFGAKSIPDFARMLGKGMNEFRRASEEIKREFRENTRDITDVVDDTKRELDKEIKAARSAIDTEAAELDPYNLKDDEAAAKKLSGNGVDDVPPASEEGPVSREDKLD